MRPDIFHRVALGLKAATFDVKWGADRVYSVGGKMFAVSGPIDDPTPTYAFKASELAFEMLIQTGIARPAP